MTNALMIKDSDQRLSHLADRHWQATGNIHLEAVQGVIYIPVCKPQ